MWKAWEEKWFPENAVKTGHNKGHRLIFKLWRGVTVC